VERAPKVWGLATLAAVFAGLTLAASSGADSATTSQQIPGVLIGLGAAQRSLQVEYTNLQVPLCDTIVAVAPTVDETPASVTVTLTEQLAPPNTPNITCAAIELIYSTTVALPDPLNGRQILGLQLRGGGLFNDLSHGDMPNVVGMSPYDARLMLSPPSGGGSIIGLLDRHTRHPHNAALPTVVAQRPASGTRITPGHTIVVLNVAP